MLLSRVFTALGLVHGLAGDPGGLQQAAERLLRLGEELDLRESCDWAHLYLGTFHYQRGRLGQAAKHLTAAVEKPFLTRTVAFLHGTFVLVLCRLAQGRDDEARGLAESLVAHMLESGNTFALPAVVAVVAEVALRQGRLAEALDWARSYDPEPIRPAFLPYMPQWTLVRVLLAANRPRERRRAAEVLDRLVTQAEETHNRRCRIEALALRSLLHQAEGEGDAARATLTESITLAQPGRYLRLFVDLGPRLAELLGRPTEWPSARRMA